MALEPAADLGVDALRLFRCARCGPISHRPYRFVGDNDPRPLARVNALRHRGHLLEDSLDCHTRLALGTRLTNCQVHSKPGGKARVRLGRKERVGFAENITPVTVPQNYPLGSHRAQQPRRRDARAGVERPDSFAHILGADPEGRAGAITHAPEEDVRRAHDQLDLAQRLRIGAQLLLIADTSASAAFSSLTAHFQLQPTKRGQVFEDERGGPSGSVLVPRQSPNRLAMPPPQAGGASSRQSARQVYL
eukprot:CAMPEP_0179947984 /NCGR_PEP_ID=MMETSP0983-20121128/21356_1 /TAXON_ID=483367 /ORGANISM="non described non described, Strain CCMP 2436" /LENGTH=247 /DNA_ID=CAMNT_0021857219 /DNA_START=189 /DNA_END=934 /DNA_ORIENTATION=+